MPSTYTALALTGSQVNELIADRDLIARWDRIDIAFTVLGLDRVQPGPVTRPTIEPSVAAAFLAARTTRARTLFTASGGRDHPYNLARRAASAGLLSDGRTGVLFGGVGSALPPGNSWTAEESHTALQGATAHAVRALEASWPFDAVIGDLDSGIFVQSDRIRRVDLQGTYAIEGPLTVPGPRTGPSILAWYDADGTGVTPSPDDFDLVIGGPHGIPLERTGQPRRADVSAVLIERDATAREVIELAADRSGEPASHAAPIDLRSALGLPPASVPTLGSPAFAPPRPELARAPQEAVR